MSSETERLLARADAVMADAVQTHNQVATTLGFSRALRVRVEEVWRKFERLRVDHPGILQAPRPHRPSIRQQTVRGPADSPGDAPV